MSHFASRLIQHHRAEGRMGRMLLVYLTLLSFFLMKISKNTLATYLFAGGLSSGVRNMFRAFTDFLLSVMIHISYYSILGVHLMCSVEDMLLRRKAGSHLLISVTST